MIHAFLTHEGVWSTRGEYFDASGRAFPAHGRLRVVHGRGVWSLQSTLSVDYPDRPLEVSNRYDIVPLDHGKFLTTWVSDNSALGRLAGRVAFVDDAILSDFAALDGASSGQEFMVRGAGGVYLNRGFILRGGEMLSSWSLSVQPWGSPA